MDMTAPGVRGRMSLWLDLIRWDRPAGTWLLLWPTLAALCIAAEGFPGWHLLVVFVVGTFLMRSAGCAANDVADRDFDRHVKRTAARPVTAGAIGVGEALAVGAVLAACAFALALTTNVLSALTGTAAGSLTITFQSLGETFLRLAAERHIDHALLHRVATIGAGTLDSLPHNGAVAVLLAVCGSNHRESYWNIAAVAIIGPAVALAVIIGLGGAFGSF